MKRIVPVLLFLFVSEITWPQEMFAGWPYDCGKNQIIVLGGFQWGDADITPLRDSMMVWLNYGRDYPQGNRIQQIYDQHDFDRYSLESRQNINATGLLSCVIDTIDVKKNGSKYNTTVYWRILWSDPITHHLIQDYPMVTELKGYASERGAVNAIQRMPFKKDIDALYGGVYDHLKLWERPKCRILTVDKIEKGKAKSVTINHGAWQMTLKGMKFIVFVKSNNRWEKAGVLQCTQPTGRNTAECEVVKGGKEIQLAIEDQNEIVAIQCEEALARNTVEGIIERYQRKPEDIRAQKMHKCLLNEKDALIEYKPTMQIDEFTGENENVVQLLRDNVVSNLKNVSRINAYDGKKQLSIIKPDYIIKGEVLGIRYDKEERSLFPCKCVIWYRLTFVNPTTNETVISPIFTLIGSASDEPFAQNKALGKNRFCMSYLLNTYFPIISKVLTVDEMEKDKALAVTIGIGTGSDVSEDTRFTVYQQSSLAKWEVIGELMVVGSEAANAQCKVLKGGKDIFRAIEMGSTLYVISHK